MRVITPRAPRSTADHVAASRNRHGSDRAIAHQTRHRFLATLGACVRVQQAWADNAISGLDS